jgi:hypothetical protein
VHSPISPKPGLAKVLTHEAVRAHLSRGRGPRLVCGDLNTPRREHPDGRVWTFARDRYGRLRADRGERWEAAELALIKGLEDDGFRDAFGRCMGSSSESPAGCGSAGEGATGSIISSSPVRSRRRSAAIYTNGATRVSLTTRRWWRISAGPTWHSARARRYDARRPLRPAPNRGIPAAVRFAGARSDGIKVSRRTGREASSHGVRPGGRRGLWQGVRSVTGLQGRLTESAAQYASWSGRSPGAESARQRDGPYVCAGGLGRPRAEGSAASGERPARSTRGDTAERCLPWVSIRVPNHLLIDSIVTSYTDEQGRAGTG